VHQPESNLDGHVGAINGGGAMLKPTSPNLPRPEIRPGHWGQWLAAGAAGLVGFVVLALLLVLHAGIAQFDQWALAAVISERQPNVTLLARAASWLGSAGVRVGLAVAGAVLLWLRMRRFLLPIALLGALAATASLVTILKIALDRSRPPANLMLGAPLTDKAFPSGHAAGGSVVVILIGLLLGLTATKPLVRRLLVIIGCLLVLLIGWSRSYLGDHWPTDVLAGWLLAAAMVSVTMALVYQTLATYPESDMSEEIDPDASPTTVSRCALKKVATPF
jgi:membrane-associated phospholipid phosphatase